MGEYNDRSEYNKKYYRANNPYPIRLGDLKMKLQTEAYEKNQTIPIVLKGILNEHFDKNEGKPTPPNFPEDRQTKSN